MTLSINLIIKEQGKLGTGPGAAPAPTALPPQGTLATQPRTPKVTPDRMTEGEEEAPDHMPTEATHRVEA